MHTISPQADSRSLIARESLHALGVLVPIQLHPIKVFPGRHPLGRAGDGMRLLRTRPYIPGEDNPRDIDKFSPPNDWRVVEWEDEAQSSVMLLADTSASMAPPIKSALRNACLLQLTYSLWRAGDRVATTFFDDQLHEPIEAANLRMQMQRLATALQNPPQAARTDITAVLHQYLDLGRNRQADLLFVVSDFVATEEREFDPESEWRPALKSMHRNIVPIVISFEIPSGTRGMMKLWDPERRSRRLVRFSAARVRRINREEQNRVASLVRKFRSAGLDCMIVSGQHQIYPQLARLARTRRLRRH